MEKDKKMSRKIDEVISEKINGFHFFAQLATEFFSAVPGVAEYDSLGWVFRI